MAKTYLDIVKYMVEAKFTINGYVDKPDIIGAVFGQTEGLLGDELDLRELQKNGKIGRIEIDLQQSNNKCFGKLYLPASLDKIETCILAAAIEAVDRVGPYEGTFSVEKVEDTRTEKRRKILDRAKELVKKLMTTGMPDSRELAEAVESDVRSSEITTYGPEKIPAGPDIDKSNEIIVVEGRADVLNLLRFDITNAIAVGGATNNIPKSVIKLCNEKEVTIFADGDRGGDMIIRTLLGVAELDYVTKAPEGKEVEELTRKEVIKALRTKVPMEQYVSMNRIVVQHSSPNNAERILQQSQHAVSPQPQTPQPQRPQAQQTSQVQQAQSQQRFPSQQIKEQQQNPNPKGAEDDDDGPVSINDLRKEYDSNEQDSSIPKIKYRREEPRRTSAPIKPALESVVLEQLSESLTQLADTLRSRLYNSEGNVIKEVPIRELISTIQDTDDIYGIVLDGIITQRLVELALDKRVRAIYGLRANPMPKKHPDIILYTKEQGKIE